MEGNGGDALPQLSKDFFNIILICKHKDQLKLRHLDIDRVVIFAKEHANIVPQHLWAALQDQQRVPQREILHLRALCEKGNERW